MNYESRIKNRLLKFSEIMGNHQAKKVQAQATEEESRETFEKWIQNL